MGPGLVAPPSVCWSFYPKPSLYSGDEMYEAIKAFLQRNTIKAIHNAAYDMTGAAETFPDLIPLIFQAYNEGLIRCTVVREKLLNLSTHGKLELGPAGKISYTLGTLMMDYYGIDRSADKGDDSWRLNYALLRGRPVSAFPADAARYAMQDAEDHYKVYVAQERRLITSREAGFDRASMATQELQSAADFALRLMTCRGFMVDQDRKRQVEKMLEEELHPDKLRELTELTVKLKTGETYVGRIVKQPLPPAPPPVKGKKAEKPVPLPDLVEDPVGRRVPWTEVAEVVQDRVMNPGEPARPWSNGAKNKDGTPKIVAATESSINTAALRQRVQRVCLENNLKVDLTETGEISATKDVMSRLASKDHVLAVYQHRQTFQKIKTTELPRISGDFVHAPINILVETGRTSSYEAKDKNSAKSGKRALFPSWNGQNVHPKVRPVAKARPGTAIFSVDYHAIDLVEWAQLKLKLFGSSVLADGFNNDIDPHAYLGAQLAFHLDGRYQQAINRAGVSSPMECWRAFDALKKINWKVIDGKVVVDKQDEWVLDLFKGQLPDAPKGGWKGGSFFKHYRTFAKPTGLGYPGGLGPDTFIDFARSPYGVIVNHDQAVELRDIWRVTYPEAPMYLEYINEHCYDPTSAGMVDDDGKPLRLYRYTSPLGMVRSRAAYCAAANGYGLQTPEAEGMKLACFALQRACWDRSIGSKLYGRVFPIVMIHDEIVGEVLWEPGSEKETGELLDEVGRIMVTEMKKVVPDVKVKTEGVCMKRWYKEPDDAKAAGDLIWKSPEQKVDRPAWRPRVCA